MAVDPSLFVVFTSAQSLATLDKVAGEDNSESGSKAKGLSKCFVRFATYFALKLAITVNKITIRPADRLSYADLHYPSFTTLSIADLSLQDSVDELH